MPNIATALRVEISRIARKELKAELTALTQANSKYRREIAALKKRAVMLEGQIASIGRIQKSSATAQTSQKEAGSPQVRFSAERFAAQRKKLGLSAPQFASLLGVSALSVYKWESGKTRPRQKQLESIAATRGLGKREVRARLEALES